MTKGESVCVCVWMEVGYTSVTMSLYGRRFGFVSVQQLMFLRVTMEAYVDFTLEYNEV